MTMMGSGSEEGQSTERKSKWVLASLASLLSGLLIYATGAIMYAFAYHRLFTEGGAVMGRWGTWADIYEWSSWVKDAGIILVILGLVFYLTGKRKGV